MSASPSAADILAKLDQIQERQTAQAAEIAALKNPTTPAREEGPFIRKGESALTSRGYSYLKMFGVLAGKVQPEDSKVELDISKRLQDVYSRQGCHRDMNNSILMPMSSQLICTAHKEEALAREIGEVVRAGITGYDREETAALRLKHWGNTPEGRQKALSWISGDGSDLVAPPMMGELIELLRNNEIFMQAGAKMLPMPPNGRVVWPRQTAAGTAYWVGTGVNGRELTASNPTTGDVTLTAKKLGVLTKIPNELFRFASVSIEQFIREDMARVIALKLDKTFLDSVGSEAEPKGLINYAGITAHTATTVGTDGNTFEPEDVGQMIGKVEEQNAVFNAFVMRPLMYTALSNRRADAVAAGDRKGQYLFNMWREMQSQYVDPTRLSVGQLNGYPVYKSTNVSQTRSKGSATNLTYILGGNFTDFLIAMSGTLEFQLSVQGDTPFVQDQTWFRGLLFADGAPRHEASFALSDTLVLG